MLQQALRKFPDLLMWDFPPFIVAFLTAEFFFKFKSFALECLAFLALWWLLAHVYRRVLARAGLRSVSRSAL